MLPPKSNKAPSKAADSAPKPPPPLSGKEKESSDKQIQSSDKHSQSRDIEEQGSQEKPTNDLLPPKSKSSAETVESKQSPERSRTIEKSAPRSKAKPEKQPSESLLPQKSKSEEPKAGADLPPVSRKEKSAEPMLPPTSQSISSKTDQSEPPIESEKAGEALGENLIAESEKVVLPDGDGGFIEVSERKTTVSYRGAKVELASMKREEREASRGLRNFFVVTFCILLLVVLMLVLNWIG